MTAVSPSTPRAHPRSPSPRPRLTSPSTRSVTAAPSSAPTHHHPPTSPSTCRVDAAGSPASIAHPGQCRQTPRQTRFSPPQSELQRAPNQPPFLTSQKLGKIRPEFCPKRQYPPCRQYLGSLPLTTTPLHRPFSLTRNSSTPPSDTNASFGPPSCTPEIPRPPLQIQTLALDPPHAPPSGPFVLKLSKNPPKSSKIALRPKNGIFPTCKLRNSSTPPSDTIYPALTHKHQPETP